MADDRVTETPHTTIIEKRGSGGTILIGIALLIAVVIGGFFLYNRSQNDAIRTDAVAGAAGAVEGAAKDVGDAVKKD